jgi:GT2 family glycosyltransferase
VVPLFRPQRWLHPCLDSVATSTGVACQLFLVDDDPTQPVAVEAASTFSSAIPIETRSNRGYAAAANRGIAVGTATYVLCLNQDARLESDYLARLVARMEADPRLGSVSGKLLHQPDPDGSPDGLIDSAGLAIRRGRRPIDIGQGEVDDGRFDGWREVFGVTAAAALYRRAALERVAVDGQYFDERFFMYKEDVDLAWRLRAAGYASAVDGRAVAYHARSVGRPASPRSGNPVRGLALEIARLWTQEASKNPAIRLTSWRNQLRMVLKNDRASDLTRSLIDILAVQVAQTTMSFVLDPIGTLRSRVGFMADVPHVLAARRRTLKKATQSVAEWLP